MSYPCAQMLLSRMSRVFSNGGPVKYEKMDRIVFRYEKWGILVRIQ